MSPKNKNGSETTKLFSIEQNAPLQHSIWWMNRNWLVGLLFAVGILLTWFGAAAVKQGIDFRAKQEFTFITAEIKNKIFTRLSAHAQLLRSGSAFIEGSVNVTKEEWRTFIEYQKIENNLPGIQGIGYSIIIPPHQLAQHEQKIRSEGFPHYSVKPVGKRDTYTSILYLKPFTGKNLRAFGYDMFSEPIRRTAMEYARDYNVASLSGKVTLVQETENDVQAGILMYAPVYQQTLPIGTITERRRAIRGWVYSPYRMNDLMKEILGDYGILGEKQFQLQIFDDSSFHSDGLLYDSRSDKQKNVRTSPIFISQSSIYFNNHAWYVQFTQDDSPSSTIDYSKAWIVAGGGLLNTVFLCIIILLLISTKNRAEALAELLTKDLKESEQKFKTLADTGHTLVWASGTDKLCNYFNSVWLEFTGRTLEQEMGNGWTEGVHPDDLQRCLDIYTGAFDRRENFSMEYRLRRYDGMYRWLQDDGNVRYNSNGEFSGYIGHCYDITERKIVEEALRKSEERLSTAMDQSHLVYWEMDAATRTFTFNDQFYELYRTTAEREGGYQMSEDVYAREFLLPEDQHIVPNDVARLMSGEINQLHHEHRIRRRDGVIRNIIVRINVVRDATGKVIGTRGANQDISEHKQVEAALKFSETQLRAVLDNTTDAIGVHINGIWEMCNPAAVKLFGVSSSKDLIGTSILNVISPDERTRITDFVQKRMALNDAPLEYLTRGLKADGSEFDMEVVVSSFMLENKRHALVILRDITERRRFENALLKSKQQYDNVVSKIPVGIYILHSTPKGAFAFDYVSPRMAEILNVTAENILADARSAFQMIHPEELDAFDKLNQKSLKEHSPFDWKGRIVADGKIKWLHISSSPEQLEHGDVLWHGLVDDITVRKHNEDELHKISGQLTSIIESTGDVVAMMDIEYRYLLFNSAFHKEFKKIFGKDLKTGDSMITALAHLPNDLADAKKHWNRVFGGEDFIVTQEFGDPTLERKWFELHFSPTRNNEGKIIGGVHVVRDITERMQMEEVLRESEDRFKYIFEYSPIGNSITYLNGKINVNKALCDMLGYSYQEMQDKKWQEITYPDDIELTQNQIDLLSSGEKKSVRFEKRYVHKNGSIVWADLSSSIRYDQQSKPLYLMSSIMDITERKKMEEALQTKNEEYEALNEELRSSVEELQAAEEELQTQNEELQQSENAVRESKWRLENIIVGTQVGTWEWNVQTGETIFNEKWGQIIGYTLAELAPISIKTWEAFAHPDDLKKSEELLERHFSGEQPFYDFESRMKHKNGEWIWVHDQGQVITRTIDGKPLMMFGTHSDITKRKQMEELLKTNERKFRTVADFTYDWEYWENEDLQIVYMSPSCERITGYNRDEFIANPSLLQTIVHPVDADRFKKHQSEVYLYEHRTDICNLEYSVIHKNGSIVNINHLCTPIFDEDKKYYGRRVSSRDITDRKKSEELLRQTQKMESIGTLAGGIAHDFNNLLNAMMGNVGLAKKRIPVDHPAVKNLERTLTAMERAATLTKQLLAYSGKGRFQSITIDVVKVVQEHIDLLVASLPKNVTIATHLPSTPVVVKGDPGQIEQIVMNVIMNGGEAIGEEQGVVTVDVSTVNMSEEELKPYGPLSLAVLRNGEYALFQVSDNGIGMNEETLTKIFDPFFTTKFVGRGLGLAAVLGIVRGHNGGITVNSTEGTGTTFKVILPIHQSGIEIMQKRDQQSEVVVYTPTIFLIDDEQYIIDLTHDIFSDENYHLLSAKDPAVGITVYEKQWRTIDVVILDYSMPKLNGKEVLIELRKINPDVKVIMSSGYSEEELSYLMGDFQPTANIQKPHSPAALLSKVNDVLELK